MRYALFGLTVVASVALALWVTLVPEGAAALTLADVGQLVGAGLVPVVAGLIGLLYRPNRFLGFAAVTLIATAITAGRVLAA